MSREHRPDDPDQGWKLHVSATVLTAERTLAAVAPELHARGVLFKAPGTLTELHRLNCGLFYGTSQIGKFVSVYPRSPQEAVELAERLDEKTRALPGPNVPFERQYRRGSRVFYRYGSFSGRRAEFDGVTRPALRPPDGGMIQDVRTDPDFDPWWCRNPFPRKAERRGRPSLFRTRYLVFEPLTQRGKGGVHKALEMTGTPMRTCVVKEGRLHGETGWDGRDGRDGRKLVLAEARMLQDLAAAGVDVPAVREVFVEQRNAYLVLEHLGDRTPEQVVREAGVLPVREALHLAGALAAGVADVHEAGRAWRDVKPRNAVVDGTGLVRPIDFEGACRSDARNVSVGRDGRGLRRYRAAGRRRAGRRRGRRRR
ncbi:protein kinase domain-containing protein [Kitasatospora phosalacinea]|nr:hypothetical protein [Kitasatospora phosalacinea]